MGQCGLDENGYPKPLRMLDIELEIIRRETEFRDGHCGCTEEQINAD